MADDVMTLTEMATAMRRDLSAIEAAQAAEKTAENSYTILTDRSRHSSDEAHQVALRDHLPALEAARAATQRAAEAARRNAQEVLHQTETARLVVTPDEQASAARQEPVIRRVVDTGSLASIRDELRAAIVADDRAALLLFASHLPDRLAKVTDQEELRRPEIGAAREELRRPEIGAARTEINRMLSQVRNALRDTSFDPVRKLASDVNARAGDVSSAAYRRRVAAESDRRITSGERVAWPTPTSLRS